MKITPLLESVTKALLESIKKNVGCKKLKRYLHRHSCVFACLYKSELFLR